MKKISIKDTPKEVQEVWMIQWLWEEYKMPIGFQKLEWCKEVMKKYPEYFTSDKNKPQ